MKYLGCLIIISLQFIVLTASCQDDLNGIPAIFSRYHNSVGEKIYLHTDKNFYVAGEIAWYKLYHLDASTHKPMNLSKVAYVEILDSANKPWVQAKVAVNNAEGNGSFYLPLTLPSGNYKLRAYTNWMKNFEVDYFFEKNITIINVQKRLSLSPGKPAADFDIQFFAEGGNLVNNIPAKVAFKGVNRYGKGVMFRGTVLDDRDTLISFTAKHAGMGSFLFTPQSNHTYKAVVVLSSGETVVKSLPEVYRSGYVMGLNDSADKIRITVQSDVLQGKVFLFAHTRSLVKSTTTSALQNGKAVFVLDKLMLEEGISHLTVFNEQRQPVCERLYFKRPVHPIGTEVNTNAGVYKTRRKVTVNIKPGNGQTVNDSASLSLTVYRLDTLQSINTPAIDTYLLLTSDLNGYVENADYYLLNDNPETNIALDHLMLTNGWRRFKWPEIFADKKPYFSYAPEYKGHIVSADVKDLKTGLPAPGIKSYLSVPGLQTAFSTAVSNSNGRMQFELPDVHASFEMILQPDNFSDSAYKIVLNDPFSTTFSERPVPAFELSRYMAGTLRQLSISMQVQNIFSGKKLKNFLVPPVDTTAFYINPDAKYLLDNFTRFGTLEEVLREYVTMVDVKKKEGRFQFAVFDLASKQMFKTSPLILLDGVPVLDLNRFMNVDPLKIYKVEVVNRKYFMGRSMFNGVLNWTSYKGDLADYEPGPGTMIDYEGLQLQREFYAPVYENESEQASHLPDYRNVLFWCPALKIACAETKSIDFYTSDLTGKFAVEVQGVTRSGAFCNKRITIDVTE